MSGHSRPIVASVVRHHGTGGVRLGAAGDDAPAADEPGDERR